MAAAPKRERQTIMAYLATSMVNEHPALSTDAPVKTIERERERSSLQRAGLRETNCADEVPLPSKKEQAQDLLIQLQDLLFH